ncbi:MAG TPA: PaaI family thioesterase [Candidatus Binatia bacterium]|nr:PaaI family thioesterase [Candidatus Binatia bacterium]
MTAEPSTPVANEDLVRGFVVDSPLGRLLGLQVDSIARDRVRVRLPFREAVTTVGDTVHGGAISALIDTAATAAAWTGADLAASPRGTTIALTVNFIAAARGQEITADARVIQRGRTITVCEVSVDGSDGRRVANALVTYKLG